jgi:hypothetical protein
MEYIIKEFIISLLEEDIIIVRQKDDVPRMTKEGAIGCVEKIIELCKIDDKPKVMVSYVASLYINKDVLKVFIDNPIPENVCANGLISSSFLAKNMAGIILKMRTRFVKDDIPTKIFSTEAEAIEWVRPFLNIKD